MEEDVRGQAEMVEDAFLTHITRFYRVIREANEIVQALAIAYPFLQAQSAMTKVNDEEPMFGVVLNDLMSNLDEMAETASLLGDDMKSMYELTLKGD